MLKANKINPCECENNLITITENIMLKGNNFHICKNSLARLELTYAINSDYMNTKFYINDSIMNIVRVEKLSDVDVNMSDKDIYIIYGDKKFLSSIYLKASHIGKRMSFQFETSGSIITVEEWNEAMDKINMLWDENKSFKDYIKIFEEKINMLENKK